MAFRAGTKVHGDMKNAKDIIDNNPSTYYRFANKWFLTIYMKKDTKNIKSVELVFDLGKSYYSLRNTATYIQAQE